jgi:hypothetical protein
MHTCHSLLGAVKAEEVIDLLWAVKYDQDIRGSDENFESECASVTSR